MFQSGAASPLPTADPVALAADPASRPPAGRVRPAERYRLALRIAASALLNVAALTGLFYSAFQESREEPSFIEIPVELEPPPAAAEPEPPPAPQQEQAERKQEQQAPENTLDEKPATDAPRAASEEKIEREATDMSSKAPRQDRPAEQSASATVESPAAETAPDRPEQKEAEPIRPASPETAPVPQPKPRALTPADPLKGTMSDPSLLAAFAPAPEYEFSSGGRQTPVAGGAAKSTYLTILFGMVMPNMRVPPGVQHAQGRISFVLDQWGSLTRITVQKSSGSAALDSAAAAAIRAAAPFPAPPNHRPIGLTFSYGSP